jgi:hypothetical protein
MSRGCCHGDGRLHLAKEGSLMPQPALPFVNFSFSLSLCPFLSLCAFVCLCVGVSASACRPLFCVWVCVCLSVSVCLSAPNTFCVCVSVCVCVCVCVSVCVCVYVFTLCARVRRSVCILMCLSGSESSLSKYHVQSWSANAASGSTSHQTPIACPCPNGKNIMCLVCQSRVYA